MSRSTAFHREPVSLGATAAAESATLVTADRRALVTYALVGADVELVA